MFFGLEIRNNKQTEVLINIHLSKSFGIFGEV